VAAYINANVDKLSLSVLTQLQLITFKRQTYQTNTYTIPYTHHTATILLLNNVLNTLKQLTSFHFTNTETSLTKEMMAASNNIFTNKSSNCSMISLHNGLPATQLNNLIYKSCIYMSLFSTKNVNIKVNFQHCWQFHTNIFSNQKSS